MTVSPSRMMVAAALGALALAHGGQALAQNAEPPAPAGPAPAAPPAGSVGGMGDINLYPKRVVIDDRNRVVSIGLYNKATSTGDYDITISDMMMTGEGRLVDLASVKDEGEKAKVKTGSGMLRWSPHRVTLPGNEAQMVRVMARVAPDLAPGEYRAHFSAVAVPPGDDGLSIQQAAGGQNGQQNSGIGVKITPRFGISIPVIIRVGETTLTTGFKDMAVVNLTGGGKGLVFKITREGTRSAFGDIAVTAPGLKKPLGEMRGVGVYTELNERQVVVPLDPQAPATALAKGTKWTITYTDDDFAPGKQLVRQEFVVP